MTDQKTTADDKGLSAFHLAALRKCDDAVFVHRDGKSTIRAIKRARPTERDPFAQEMSVEFAVGTRWYDYAKGFGCAYPVPSFAGFEMCGNYTDGTLQTIFSLLKVGDELTLDWQKDCQSPVVAGADMHVDRLYLVVARGKNRLRFLIDDFIGPDNSASMIKNVRYPSAPEYSLVQS